MGSKEKYERFINRIIDMTPEQLQQEAAKIKARLASEWDYNTIVKKIEYWTPRYDFCFQFWGTGNNNVFINKDDVEVASFGGEEGIIDILLRTLEWCEKSNPRIKYPDGL